MKHSAYYYALIICTTIHMVTHSIEEKKNSTLISKIQKLVVQKKKKKTKLDALATKKEEPKEESPTQLAKLYYTHKTENSCLIDSLEELQDASQTPANNCPHGQLAVSLQPKFLSEFIKKLNVNKDDFPNVYRHDLNPVFNRLSACQSSLYNSIAAKCLKLATYYQNSTIPTNETINILNTINSAMHLKHNIDARNSRRVNTLEMLTDCVNAGSGGDLYIMPGVIAKFAHNHGYLSHLSSKHFEYMLTKNSDTHASASSAIIKILEQEAENKALHPETPYQKNEYAIDAILSELHPHVALVYAKNNMELFTSLTLQKLWELVHDGDSGYIWIPHNITAQFATRMFDEIGYSLCSTQLAYALEKNKKDYPTIAQTLIELYEASEKEHGGGIPEFVFSARRRFLQAIIPTVGIITDNENLKKYTPPPILACCKKPIWQEECRQESLVPVNFSSDIVAGFLDTPYQWDMNNCHDINSQSFSARQEIHAIIQSIAPEYHQELMAHTLRCMQQRPCSYLSKQQNILALCQCLIKTQSDRLKAIDAKSMNKILPLNNVIEFIKTHHLCRFARTQYQDGLDSYIRTKKATVPKCKKEKQTFYKVSLTPLGSHEVLAPSSSACKDFKNYISPMSKSKKKMLKGADMCTRIATPTKPITVLITVFKQLELLQLLGDHVKECLLQEIEKELVGAYNPKELTYANSFPKTAIAPTGVPPHAITVPPASSESSRPKTLHEQLQNPTEIRHPRPIRPQGPLTELLNNNIPCDSKGDSNTLTDNTCYSPEASETICTPNLSDDEILNNSISSPPTSEHEQKLSQNRYYNLPNTN